MSEQTTAPSRPICGTCWAWQAPRRILPFAVAWAVSSGACGNRKSPGFSSSRGAKSGCKAWSALVDGRR